MKKIVLLFLLLIPFSLFAEPEWISTSVSDEEDVIEIDIRDTEIIYDMDGNVLSQDETTYNYFKWFINTGDTSMDTISRLQKAITIHTIAECSSDGHNYLQHLQRFVHLLNKYIITLRL